MSLNALAVVLVVALAAASVSFLAMAMNDWFRARPERSTDSLTSHRWPGVLVSLAVSLLLLGGLWGLSALFGWELDRTLWIGFGAFLTLATVTKPRWFWEHYKARWLRDLIGDELTMLFYLLFAGAMMWVGSFTTWRFGRH